MASHVGLSSSSLPVTSTFALPFSLYYTYLQARVIQQRISAKAAISQTSITSSPTTPSSTSPTSSETHVSEDRYDPLLASIRAQANFIENVPLALIFAALVEGNGGDKRVLAGLLSVLFSARVLHAQFGLTPPKYHGWGRGPGFMGTAAVVNGLAVWGAWLGRGYWGY